MEHAKEQTGTIGARNTYGSFYLVLRMEPLLDWKEEGKNKTKLRHYKRKYYPYSSFARAKTKNLKKDSC